MRPSLKIETWNLLSELGRTQSLAQAAERLEMDLPAASRLVSSLEKELGIELLDRKRKPAQIVTKSLELFSEADRIARQFQRLLKTVDSIKHQDTIKPKRILKVSLPANIDRSAYLNAFSNFERKHPGLRVEVLIDAGEEGLLNKWRGRCGLLRISACKRSYHMDPSGTQRYVSHGFARLPSSARSSAKRRRTSEPYAPAEKHFQSIF